MYNDTYILLSSRPYLNATLPHPTPQTLHGFTPQLLKARCAAVLSDQPPLSPENLHHPVHVSSVHHLGHALITGHNDAQIRVWDVRELHRKPVDVLRGHRGWVWSVSPYVDESGSAQTADVIVSGGTSRPYLSPASSP